MLRVETKNGVEKVMKSGNNSGLKGVIEKHIPFKSDHPGRVYCKVKWDNNTTSIEILENLIFIGESLMISKQV